MTCTECGNTAKFKVEFDPTARRHYVRHMGFPLCEHIGNVSDGSLLRDATHEEITEREQWWQQQLEEMAEEWRANNWRKAAADLPMALEKLAETPSLQAWVIGTNLRNGPSNRKALRRLCLDVIAESGSYVPDELEKLIWKSFGR